MQPRASDRTLGRAGIHSALERTLATTRRGAGSLFLLEGEPGSGKSTTLDTLETLSADQGMGFARGRCAEIEGAPALLPWEEIMQHLSRSAGREPAPPPPAGDAVGAFRRMREITDELLADARARPLVVAIDDLHAADAASLRLLGYAAREAGRAPLLIVGAARPPAKNLDETRAALLAEARSLSAPLRIGPLTREEVRGLAETFVGRALPDALVEAFFEQSTGNPLFLRQLTGLWLATEGDPESPDAVALVRSLAPQGIRDAIEHRLEPLHPKLRETLALAALRGRRFETDLVLEAWSATGSGPPPDFSAALHARILEPSAPDTLAFGHVLFREVLLETLRSHDREEGNAALARAIDARRPETDPWIGARAQHALSAGAGLPVEQVADWAALAAESALARHAQDEALDWSDRALGSLEGRLAPGSIARLHVLRGQARWRTGESERAREDFRVASRLGRKLGDPLLEAEAAVGFAGRTDVRLGPAEESIALLESASERLPAAPGRLRTEVFTLLATSLSLSGERERSEAAIAEAIGCGEASGDPGLLAYALTGRQFTLFRPGRTAERRAVTARALEQAARGDDAATAAHARFGAVYDALEAGDFAALDRHMASYGGIAERLRQPFLLWQHRAMRATRALAAGRLSDAEALAEEARRLGERSESPNALAVYAAHLYGLRRAQGRLAELLPLISGLGETLPDVPSFVYARAEVELAAGREDEARAFLRAASSKDFRDLPDDFNTPALLAIASRLCVALGETGAAGAAYEALLPLDGSCVTLGLGNVFDGAVALQLGRLATELGHTERAYAHLTDAEELHARAGARVHLAETWDAKAELQRRSGDSNAAGRLAAKASALRRTLGIEAPEEEEASPRPELEKDDAPSWGRTPNDHWRVRFEGGEATLPDSRGLAYLAELLARPGEPVHVLDLIARVAPEGTVSRPESGGMELLDEQARREYRECIEGLRETVEEAQARGDVAGAEGAQQELEQIEDALASALGLGGRTRRAGDAVERARKSVYNRVRDAIKRIDSEIPVLAEHLRASVSTGRVCVYSPEPPRTWLLPVAD